MIPPVIHYCWFGSAELPPLAQRCLASWRQFAPQCRLQRWSEDNFDVGAVPYTAEAHRLGKYAYVSDYVRLWVLYHHGGIYLDTDVELLRPIDHLLSLGPFMGQEQPEHDDGQLHCATGLGMACEPGQPFVGQLLDFYARRHCISLTGRTSDTIVTITNRLLRGRPLEQLEGGLQRCAGFTILPWPYLCPLDYYTGRLRVTADTCAIHHYAASWVDDRAGERLMQRLRRRLRAMAVRWWVSFRRNSRYSAMDDSQV